MRYHASLLCLLAIAESVCADTDLGYSPIVKPVLKVGAMAPKNSGSSIGAFTPFGAAIPQAASLKRQTTGSCPASNMHKCANGKCCPNGYDCESDSVESWCCPTGQTCTGAGTCMAGTTDCRNVNGGDGCCPTATTYCDTDSAGNYGCREITGSSGGGGGSSVCVDAGYYPCADLSGCCKTGTTCVSGADYCQKPCDSGYSECSGGCCSPGYTCNGQNCKKVSAGVSYSTSTRTRISTTYSIDSPTTTSYTRRTSTQEPEPTFDLGTSDETTSTTSTSRVFSPATTSSTGTAAPIQTAITISPSSGSALRIPVIFGMAVVGLCALAQL